MWFSSLQHILYAGIMNCRFWLSVALGLTVFGMLFLKSVVKKLTEEEDDNEADGGE